MSKTAMAFKNGKAFIPSLTAGDPDLETTKQLIIAMAESGADLIEIAIPFSDPVAEQVIIQQADERALRAGTTTDKIFDMISEVRKAIPNLPLAFISYINPIYVYGCEKFFSKCEEAEIDAVIVPDIPYEEKEELLPYCKKHGVDLISIIASTSENRIKMITSEAKGFLYCVSSSSESSELESDIKNMTDKIRRLSDIPTAINPGITSTDQARKMAAYADAVIADIKIAELCEQYGKDCVEPIKAYVKEMKDAIKEL